MLTFLEKSHETSESGSYIKYLYLSVVDDNEAGIKNWLNKLYKEVENVQNSDILDFLVSKMIQEMHSNFFSNEQRQKIYHHEAYESLQKKIQQTFSLLAHKDGLKTRNKRILEVLMVS